MDPKIYAYTTPGVVYHEGWTKIGYTEQDVEDRIAQQVKTAGIKHETHWALRARFEDTGERFTDKAFHAYLKKLGFEREGRSEWFRIEPPEGKAHLYDFRENHGHPETGEVRDYDLRPMQEAAVAGTLAYMQSHPGGEYLWNAKPRFGKTLAVYDLVKRAGMRHALVLTNRPAVANSWYDDYADYMGDPSGLKFVSGVDALKNRPYVMTRDEYVAASIKTGFDKGMIAFVSLQDLKGGLDFGGKYEKLQWVRELHWDLVVIDEFHEGVDTEKADVALDQIDRDFTLNLSGTPFKAIASGRFADEQIFNYTYADEQKARRDWDDPDASNPYGDMPKLNLFTYRMSDIVHDQLKQGVDLTGDGGTSDWAFDLNEFFKTSGGRFVHEDSVDRFLDALASQSKFPFSDRFRDELKHTFWLMDRVASAKAMAEKLKSHPVFKDYEVVLAAGDGKLDADGNDVVDDKSVKKVFDKVRVAIGDDPWNTRTITLSVGQLTTGVTVPEWSAVLMLCNLKSPALYMQAAFRAQNPYVFRAGDEFYRKTDAYVFDFDPARTLVIFEQFANGLVTGDGGLLPDVDTRKVRIKELLNFFPVIGEDPGGEMVELDAEQVLSVPRAIRSQEVVRSGFMSNDLFQNMGVLFKAPPGVLDLMGDMKPAKAPKKGPAQPVPSAAGLDVDPATGDVDVPKDKVIGLTQDVFGGKIYDAEFAEQRKAAIKSGFDAAADAGRPSFYDMFRERYADAAVDDMIEQAKEHYGEDLGKAGLARVGKKLKAEAKAVVGRIQAEADIRQNRIEADRKAAVDAGTPEDEAEGKYQSELAELHGDIKAKLADAAFDLARNAMETAVEAGETARQNKQKASVEEAYRDRLRGFSRTIPSFLMAYDEPDITDMEVGVTLISLATFDEIMPDEVFREVTGISKETFRLFRDGGDFTDPKTGETTHFDGGVFDEVVFDDSVKLFLKKKAELADWFDEGSTEDIFSYIPPQRTNQIFTPRAVVADMADRLEQESPGCFDDGTKTFIDLYMKSGMYITEIVKRLYRSKKMKAAYPDDKDRLKHIFEHQVYGLAPTEIIYKIAMAYIFGFDPDGEISREHFKCLDALEYAKDGTLRQKLDELFD